MSSGHVVNGGAVIPRHSRLPPVYRPLAGLRSRLRFADISSETRATRLEQNQADGAT